MKVLQIINSLTISGAEKLVVDSVPIYQAKGIETDVIQLTKLETQFYKKLKNDSKGKTISLSKRSVYNPILLFKLIPYFRRYDIIHLHLFPTLYWGVFAKLLTGGNKPIVYTEHSTSNKRRNNLILKFSDRFVYKQLDFIGCISEATSHSLKRYLELGTTQKIGVIQNGINLDDFFLKYPPPVQGIKPNSFVLIQVSRFTPQKDQMTLIESLKYLPKEVELILVGDGPLKVKCEERAEQLNLENRIQFLGERGDIPALFQSANLAVQSSNYEGFGLVAAEAMASGKTIVASDVPGLRDVVQGAGLLFEKGNIKDLAEKIEDLYKNKKKRKSLEEKAIKRAREFDIKIMVDKYIETYKKLIS